MSVTDLCNLSKGPRDVQSVLMLIQLRGQTLKQHLEVYC